ncbi:MAG TPA: MFS transporter [Bryobacteraceae bacterium]|nr:MFS transporter [Bryobacteraceae bacterium]
MHRARVPAGTWWICGLLLAATILNYLDRQVLSLTAEKIMAEFRLDQESFGRILAAFRYSYAALQLGGGWLVDAFGARGIYPGAVGLWSLAGGLTAAAGSLGALWGCRFLLGIGAAFNWPCALKVTERMLPPEDRPLANGIFNSGTAAGAILAPVIVTVLTVRLGWRAAFVFTGLLGGLWVTAWLGYTRGRSEQIRARAVAASEIPRVMLDVLRGRGFWMLAASAIVINSVSYFLADWIPLYLKTERGFSFGAGNALSMLVYGGMDAGNLAVGFVVRRLAAGGMSVAQARHRALAASCLCMSAAMAAGWTPWRYVALACIVLTAVGVAAFLVIYLTLVQDLDPLHVGTTSGLLGGLGNLCYGLLSPYIGRLADLHETGLTFLLIGVLPWAAYGSIVWGERGSVGDVAAR